MVVVVVVAGSSCGSVVNVVVTAPSRGSSCLVEMAAAAGVAAAAVVVVIVNVVDVVFFVEAVGYPDSVVGSSKQLIGQTEWTSQHKVSSSDSEPLSAFSGLNINPWPQDSESLT